MPRRISPSRAALSAVVLVCPDWFWLSIVIPVHPGRPSATMNAHCTQHARNLQMVRIRVSLKTIGPGQEGRAVGDRRYLDGPAGPYSARRRAVNHRGVRRETRHRRPHGGEIDGRSFVPTLAMQQVLDSALSKHPWQ